MSKEDYYDSVYKEIEAMDEALEELINEPYEVKDSEIRIFRGKNILE